MIARRFAFLSVNGLARPGFFPTPVVKKLKLEYIRIFSNNAREMKMKFYQKIIGTLVIFKTKKFQIMCHMIGVYHY